MHNAEWKPNMKDMQEGAHPKQNKKSVACEFAVVKYKSETYYGLKKYTEKIAG